MVAANISFGERSMWIFNTLFHQSYAVLSVFILWTIFYNYDLNSTFSYHVILTTLAYIPLMGEAIVLFASDNVWSLGIARTTKYWIHGIILFVSCSLVTAGVAIEIYLKDGNHFKSTHAWTGLVSWIFIMISQFLGLAAAKTQIFSSFVRPVIIKFLHNIFGLLGYVFGIVSLGYAIDMRSFTRLISSDAKTALFYVLGITTFWSVLAALKSALGQMKNIIKSS